MPLRILPVLRKFYRQTKQFVIKIVSLLWFSWLYYFYGLLTAYFQYEKVMSIRLPIMCSVGKCWSVVLSKRLLLPVYGIYCKTTEIIAMFLIATSIKFSSLLSFSYSMVYYFFWSWLLRTLKNSVALFILRNRSWES